MPSSREYTPGSMMLSGDPESALMEDFRDVMRIMGDVLDGMV